MFALVLLNGRQLDIENCNHEIHEVPTVYQGVTFNIANEIMNLK
jgi:hypothetical protein